MLSGILFICQESQLLHTGFWLTAHCSAILTALKKGQISIVQTVHCQTHKASKISYKPGKDRRVRKELPSPLMEQADPWTAEGVGVYFCPYKVKRSNVGDVCSVILSDANWALVTWQHQPLDLSVCQCRLTEGPLSNAATCERAGVQLHGETNPHLKKNKVTDRQTTENTKQSCNKCVERSWSGESHTCSFSVDLKVFALWFQTMQRKYFIILCPWTKSMQIKA